MANQKKSFSTRTVIWAFIVSLPVLFIFYLLMNSDRKEIQEAISKHIDILLITSIGIVLLAIDLSFRHEQIKQEQEFQKEDRQERKRWLKEKAESLAQIANQIAIGIADKLGNETEWATKAIEEAKIGPIAKTLFGERMRHFREEKKAIVEHFLPFLINRCQHHVDKGKTVYLIVDSGTTMYFLLKELSAEAVRHYASSKAWVKNYEKIIVVTNNLMGIEAIMEEGRINSIFRFSPLAIKSRLLPGEPLAMYLCVTGPDTVKAVEDLGKMADDKNTNISKENEVFIGIVTGNWISVRKESPHCPVPLARGKGHLEVKQAFIDKCSEVYVLTPLGRIFVNQTPEEINKALHYDGKNKDMDNSPYKQVVITEKKAACIKLVSTLRMDEKRILYRHGVNVEQKFKDTIPGVLKEITNDMVKLSIEKMPHLLFKFDKLPKELKLEEDEELPHKNTHTDIIKRYLDIGDN